MMRPRTRGSRAAFLAPAATLRVVQHTPDSLEQRSAELRRRAAVQGATYEGVDVGRPD
jgi:hypothetical protein